MIDNHPTPLELDEIPQEMKESYQQIEHVYELMNSMIFRAYIKVATKLKMMHDADAIIVFGGNKKDIQTWLDAQPDDMQIEFEIDSISMNGLMLQIDLTSIGAADLPVKS